MDHFGNGCAHSASSIRRAAIQDQQNVVAQHSSSDSKEPGDITRVRNRVAMLKNQNAFSAAELLQVHHECLTCHRSSALSTQLQQSPAILATRILRDRHETEKRIREIMQQVTDRNALIQKLEQQLRTYEEIRKHLKIEVPGDSVDYFFKLDDEGGVSLVVQARGSGSSEPSSKSSLDLDSYVGTTSKMANLDLLDFATLPPIAIPVLAPVSAQAIPSAALTKDRATPQNAPEQPAELLDQGYTGSRPEPTLVEHKQPNPPILGIWSSGAEHTQALHNEAALFVHHNPNNVPLMFVHGIQYVPPPTRLPNDMYRSRMVIFKYLEPDMTWFDVLSCVRGGPIHRIARADARTMLVSFVHARDAHRYKEYIQESLCALVRINGVGDGAIVRLIETPSYPLRESLLRDITQRGVTRCLAVPECNASFVKSLELLFAYKKIRDYIITQDEEKETDGKRDEEQDGSVNHCGIDDVVIPTLNPMTPHTPINIKTEANATTDTSTTATDPTTVASHPAVVDDELTEEWFNPDDHKPPSPSDSAGSCRFTCIIHFRDITLAQTAHREILRAYPYSGVRYARDPCAGPLAEIDTMELDNWDSS